MTNQSQQEEFSMHAGVWGQAANRPTTEDENVVWFAEECSRNHVRVDRLVRMAERARDTELAAFFRRALDVSDQLPHAA